MNAYDLLLRLKAFKEGRPLPRGETRHFPLAEGDETLILAFVRMGGESSPWGIAFGHPGAKPRVLTVPEPRNRDAVADMVAEFAPLLLEHLFQPEHSSLAIDNPKQTRPLRQIWLPNPTHRDMFHYLNYAYTFTKWGTAERVRVLNALGRAAGWLFREGLRPGEVFVMVATEALREAFTFPAEATRQGHLGYLMAWLETQAGREARIKAAGKAEGFSIATSLNPEVEREELEPLVESYNDGRSAGDEQKASRFASKIHSVLERELLWRFELTDRARKLLARDKRKVNNGVDALIKAANEAGLKANFYTNLAWVVGAASAIGATGADRLMTVGFWHANAADAVWEKTLLDYKAKYKATAHLGYLPAIRVTEMLASAMTKTGSTDPVKIAFALEGMKYQGPTGESWMRAEDHQIIVPLFLMNFTKVGQPGVKYDEEGTGYGWKTEALIPARDAIPAMKCAMERPK